jgi:O-antigen ligase
VEAWRWREGLLFLVALEMPLGHALFGLALLTVLAIGEVMAGEPVWVRTPLDAGWLSVLAVALVSGVLSDWRYHAVAAAASFAVGVVITLRAVILASARRREFPARFLATWAACGVVAGIWSITRLGASANARADLPSLTHNELGIAMAVVLVLLAGFALEGARRARVAAALAMPIPTLALVLTWSRGAWAAAAIGLGMLFVASRPRRWYALAAIAITLVLAAPFLSVRYAWHVDRLRDLAPPEGQFSRLTLWRSAIGMLADRPLVGTGLATFQFAYERYRKPLGSVADAPFAHNLFLNFAVELGVLGLAALLLLLGQSIVMLARWQRQSAGEPAVRIRSAVIGAACAALIVHQMVDGTLLRIHIMVGFFALLGIAAAGLLAVPVTAPNREAGGPAGRSATTGVEVSR